MVQYARPDSDISNDGWSSSPLYEKIDESTPSDSDYITSADDGDICELGLSSLNDPTMRRWR